MPYALNQRYYDGGLIEVDEPYTTDQPAGSYAVEETGEYTLYINVFASFKEAEDYGLVVLADK